MTDKKDIIIPPKDGKLILLSDIQDMVSRKEEELEFYQKELEKLHLRMSLIQHDIEITKTIIKMVEHEKIYDVKQEMENGHDDKLI